MSDRMVAGYARVSSEQQAKSGTIDSQIASLRERVASDGEQIAEELDLLHFSGERFSMLRPYRLHSAVVICSQVTSASVVDYKTRRCIRQ